ncbi:hypothetical protein HYH03_015709 [Edaphochlamys debaryana]|uniref:Rhodanese domain-containing protein n=1 Tax=Edaphochlamys debaryana TaxID=47281 RepID=A0A835XT73_9CHLO|nr:hypothetical protein HYH03_015709 [Edaphochlamys debaryana]|eukprot:KAG2485539.1 hypothetical protein HYH03_015709 [Edaphochlamys debaryana]
MDRGPGDVEVTPLTAFPSTPLGNNARCLGNGRFAGLLVALAAALGLACAVLGQARERGRGGGGREDVQLTSARVKHAAGDIFRTPGVPAPIREVTPQEALELIQSQGYSYLDVRTPEEWAAGHPPGSINVPVISMGPAGRLPNTGFNAEVERAYPDRAQPLVVGCKSGARSRAAIQELSAAGYVHLVNVAGGFDLWSASGLPVEPGGGS